MDYALNCTHHNLIPWDLAYRCVFYYIDIIIWYHGNNDRIHWVESWNLKIRLAIIDFHNLSNIQPSNVTICLADLAEQVTNMYLPLSLEFFFWLRINQLGVSNIENATKLYIYIYRYVILAYLRTFTAHLDRGEKEGK